MAEEIIIRKLGEMQARMAEHSAWLRDFERRLAVVEEALGALVIPRIGGRSSRSLHEYIVEVTPAYGAPTTVTLTARSDKQAMEKAKEKARFPIPATAKILSKVEVEPSSSSPEPSRWVLELYPDEIPVWRDFIRVLEAQPLTERERSFMRSLDYYIRTERKITIPMISWLYAISRKYGITVPEVPYPRGASSRTSSPPVYLEEKILDELRFMTKKECTERYEDLVFTLTEKGYPEATVKRVLDRFIEDPVR